MEHPPGTMNTEKTVAIVVADDFDRMELHELLIAEGFATEPFSSPDEFIDAIGASSRGALVVDLDHSGNDFPPEALLDFANRWSRELPTIAIASEPSHLPRDPLLPIISRAAGESHLLYFLYGAMSEPTTTEDHHST